jgi:dihydroneopterin aldolase
MDSIIARGLSFKACHGVLPGEKIDPQPFKVDAELFLDLQAAGEQDDLSLSVDYDKVYHLVRDIVEGPSCELLEALAEKIAQALLAKFPVTAVEVTVYKPQAPVAGEFDYFAVNIKRRKKNNN